MYVRDYLFGIQYMFFFFFAQLMTVAYGGI